MSRDVSLALVGIGGYGGIYASAVLDAGAPKGHKLVAAVDPFAALSPCLAELTERSVPIYPTLQAMYAAQQPDLVIISSPIHLHCTHTLEAQEHGSHVLCEKPLCVTPSQARDMIRARDATGRQV